jgi:putative transposase
VPSRLQRRESLYHFVTISCYRRQALFAAAEVRDWFLDSLERARRKYEFVVVGYVVMPEHIHMLIGEPNQGSVSTVVQVVKQWTARAALPIVGGERFWQTRFYDFNIGINEKKRMEKLRYIHRNPVKRGLVADPPDWMWSSARHYWRGEPGRVAVAVPVPAPIFTRSK